MKVVALIAMAVLAMMAVNMVAAEDVVILGEDNFDQTKEGVWLIKFYAPWCGHCKRLAPTWDEYATKTKDTKLNVAKVDCTEHQSICQANGIRRIPTLKLFQKGQPTDYKGARTIDAFNSFVNQHAPGVLGDAPAKTEEAAADEGAAAAGDAAGETVVLTADNFEAQTKSGRWFIKFYAPWCGHCKRLAPTWDALGGKAKGFNVGKVDCTQHGDLCKQFGVRGYPTLKLFENGEHKEDYRGGRDEASLLKFGEP